MGVPVFFKWLCDTCPQILLDKNKPPGIDYLYLDMNGILHPCSHPTSIMNIPKPDNFNKILENIELFLDDLISICKPKKLLYIAIDGVAPRAKMNQQRSRRFRSALEIHKEKIFRIDIKNKFEKIGINIEKDIWDKNIFDHNAITPGTEFMNKIYIFLKKYISNKLKNNKNWENLKIILNDSSNEGEGEHKILDFIRGQRKYKEYNPNLNHCIFGADADLIFLSLSTHEPNIFILREIPNYKTTDFNPFEKIYNFNIDMNFIQISMVRKWIKKNTKYLKLNFEFNLERIIDDFIFICFFVGNDFLPHLPGIGIKEGGIDILFNIYKKKIWLMDDYMTLNGNINLNNLKIYLNNFDIIEEFLINNSNIKNLISLKRDEKFKKLRNKKYESIFDFEIINESNLDKRDNFDVKNIDNIILNNLKISKDYKKEIYENELKLLIKKDFNNSKIKFDNSIENLKNIENYKEKYYKEKFNLNSSNYWYLTKILTKFYIQGLIWNYSYYYKGCISWNWFYPFYYPPLISDLKNFDIEEIKFKLGKPFDPLEQLMAVLSPLSYKIVPKCYQYLMNNINSKIIDWYPNNFIVDLKNKNKKISWLGEIILPFIDEDRLIRVLNENKQFLTSIEEGLNNKNPLLIFSNENLLSENKNIDIFGTFKLVENINIYNYIQPTSVEPICKLLKGAKISKNKLLRYDLYNKKFKKLLISIDEYLDN